MTREEIHEVVLDAVSTAMKNHPCWMTEEDRAVMRDVIQGGRYVKRSILLAIAGAVIYAIAKGFSILKIGS